MKKYLFFLLLTMISLVSFTSCDNNEEDPKPEWAKVAVNFTVTPKDGISPNGKVYVFENIPIKDIDKASYDSSNQIYIINGVEYFAMFVAPITNGSGSIFLPKLPRVNNYFFRFDSPSASEGLIQNYVVDQREQVEIKFIW